jgi:hypothetical protein
MKPITLIRGTHIDEFAAYVLAEKVYEQLKTQADCQLITVPYESTGRCIIDTISGSDNPEQAIDTLKGTIPQKEWEDNVKDIFGCIGEEYQLFQEMTGLSAEELEPKYTLYALLWLLDGRYEESLAAGSPSEVFSFHNYPVSRKIKEYTLYKDNTSKIKPDKLKTFCAAPDSIWTILQGEALCYSDEQPKIIEIPAVYSLGKKKIELPLLDYTAYERYLYEVDLQETERQGLMSDEFATKITSGILRVASGELEVRIK